MSLFGIFGGDSKSSTSTSTSDEKVAADNGATALRSDGGSIILNSNEVAQAELGAAQNFLASSTSFLDKQLTNFLTVVDHRATAAENNLAAGQQLAADATSHAQATDTDKIIKLITIAVVGAVVVMGFKSGAFK